jgi:short-subunit dehydrogenase
MNKSAIITGASSGIGKSIAYELAKKKYDLLLIARTEELLQQICAELTQKFGIKAHYISMDLSKKNDFSIIGQRFLEIYDTLDVLVNNAGVGYYGEIETINPENIEALFWTNVFSHILITKELIPIMKQQGYGKIVNIISLIVFFPLKKWSLYAASKSAQMNFFRSLRRELKRYRIRVINVYPSSTKTGFFRNLNLPYEFPTYDDPLTVARKVIKAIENKKNEVFISPLHWLGRLFYLWS